MDLSTTPQIDRSARGKAAAAAVPVLLFLAVITTVVILACRPIAVRLTVNLSSSMPRGLYWLRPAAAIDLRSTVDLFPPANIRSLITTRRYLPPGCHLLKRVAALAGDHVCTDHHRYVVNGRLLSFIATTDHDGRSLPPPYPFCAVVPAGSAWLAADGNSSLDSRYFGPVPLNTLTPATGVWTFY